MYPAIEYYDPDNNSVSCRDVLVKWHTSDVESNAVFDFNQEIAKYCRQDVVILREAVTETRKLVYELFEVDTFTCVTIASYVVVVTW